MHRNKANDGCSAGKETEIASLKRQLKDLTGQLSEARARIKTLKAENMKAKALQNKMTKLTTFIEILEGRNNRLKEKLEEELLQQQQQRSVPPGHHGDANGYNTEMCQFRLRSVYRDGRYYVRREDMRWIQQQLEEVQEELVFADKWYCNQIEVERRRAERNEARLSATVEKLNAFKEKYDRYEKWHSMILSTKLTKGEFLTLCKYFQLIDPGIEMRSEPYKYTNYNPPTDFFFPKSSFSSSRLNLCSSPYSERGVTDNEPFTRTFGEKESDFQQNQSFSNGLYSDGAIQPIVSYSDALKNASSRSHTNIKDIDCQNSSQNTFRYSREGDYFSPSLSNSKSSFQMSTLPPSF